MGRFLLLASLVLGSASMAQASQGAADDAQLKRWRKQGASAVPQMLWAIVCNESEVLFAQVLSEWARMGPPAMAKLLRERSVDCEEGGPNTTAVIANLACAMPGDWGKLRQSLASLFAVPLDDNRRRIILAAAELCPRNEPLAALIVPLLIDEIERSPATALDVVNVVRSLGPLAAKATPALARLLERRTPEGEPYATRPVLEALIAIGPGAKEATPHLRGIVKPRSIEDRTYAAYALGSIGHAPGNTRWDLLELLAEALEPEHPDDACRVRVGAAARVTSAIGRLGPPQDQVLEKALHVLRRAQFERPKCRGVLDEVLRALTELGPKAAGEWSIARDTLRNPDEHVRTRELAGQAVTAMNVADEQDRKLIAALKRKEQLHAVFPGMKRVFPPREIPQDRRGSRDLGDLGTELQVCLEEGGRALPSSWDGLMALHGLAGDTDEQRGLAARCLERRLCGPDEATLVKALSLCCAQVYPNERPGWCPAPL